MTARERARKFIEELRVTTNIPLPISTITCDVEILNDLEAEMVQIEAEGFKRGLEEAAKICEKHIHNFEHLGSSQYEDLSCDCPSEISDIIRAAIEKKEKE